MSILASVKGNRLEKNSKIKKVKFQNFLYIFYFGIESTLIHTIKKKPFILFFKQYRHIKYNCTCIFLLASFFFFFKEKTPQVKLLDETSVYLKAFEMA